MWLHLHGGSCLVGMDGGWAKLCYLLMLLHLLALCSVVMLALLGQTHKSLFYIYIYLSLSLYLSCFLL